MEVEIVSNKLNISLKNLGKRKIYGIEREWQRKKNSSPKMEENLLKYYNDMREKELISRKKDYFK